MPINFVENLFSSKQSTYESITIQTNPSLLSLISLITQLAHFIKLFIHPFIHSLLHIQDSSKIGIQVQCFPINDLCCVHTAPHRIDSNEKLFANSTYTNVKFFVLLRCVRRGEARCYYIRTTQRLPISAYLFPSNLPPSCFLLISANSQNKLGSIVLCFDL